VLVAKFFVISINFDSEVLIMSRIGKAPITVPKNVEVSLTANTLVVKGPLGVLTRIFRPEVFITIESGLISVTRQSDDRLTRSLHGLTRTLISNMIEGVTVGFTKRLEIIGVGYRAQMQGARLVMQLGYSHPVEVDSPLGITIAVEANTKVLVQGFDKQLVGDIAAKIRSYRLPEPYKGKGIRYAGEVVRRKAGKAGKK
jgi:large subunit ribosomal protein L6